MAPGGGGNDGTKTDMERVGFFSELGYTSLGDRYPQRSGHFAGFNIPAAKGKQMMTQGIGFSPQAQIYAKFFWYLLLEKLRFF